MSHEPLAEDKKMSKIENTTVAKQIGGELLPWAVSDYSSESTGPVEVRLVSDEGSHGRLYVLCHAEQQVVIFDHYTGEEVGVKDYAEFV